MLSTVGAILVVLTIGGSAAFLVAREKARRVVTSEQARHDAERHRSYGDWPAIPTINVPVFHDTGVPHE